MTMWKRVLRRSFTTAGLTGAATTLAAALCGWQEQHNAIAPLNAISHIAWGEEAAVQDEYSTKYTATGVVLNMAAMWSWSLIFEALRHAAGKGDKSRPVTHSVAGGALVSALAYVVDYHIVPKRLTPGLEDRLSSRSLLVIYIVLATSLAAGGLLSRRTEPS
jgi:hypothetical protein